MPANATDRRCPQWRGEDRDRFAVALPSAEWDGREAEVGARSAGGVRAIGGSGRGLRRARFVALAAGAFLLAWCLLLGAFLPATADAQHWSLAWMGLDGAESVAALATAVLLARSDVRASLTAAAGAVLLLTDAWFDVCTSAPGSAELLAVVEAVVVEVPLAAGAIWLAVALLRPLRSSDSGGNSPRS